MTVGQRLKVAVTRIGVWPPGFLEDIATRKEIKIGSASNKYNSVMAAAPKDLLLLGTLVPRGRQSEVRHELRMSRSLFYSAVTQVPTTFYRQRHEVQDCRCIYIEAVYHKGLEEVKAVLFARRHRNGN